MTSTNLPLLTAKHICVIRNRNEILHDVSLNINLGDFITIIGPNGAGKTMLIKCLLGIETPTHGHVERAEGLRIGYVPQRVVVDASLPMTVARFLRLRTEITDAKRDEIIADTDIAGVLHQPLHVLSGGELQRVLLARALLHNPQLLVLDEPAQNLDVSGQLAFYNLLQTVAARQAISVLMVSHDLHMVMATTTQVVCLFHHVCCSGTPQTVTKDPEFIKLFGTDMAAMMAIYHHAHSHDHTHDHMHEHSHTHDEAHPHA